MAEIVETAGIGGLAAGDPANGRYQQDLWALNMNVGTILELRGEPEGALTSFQDALAVAERRAAADPSDDQLRSDMATAQGKVASIAARSTRSAQGSGKGRWGLRKLFE